MDHKLPMHGRLADMLADLDQARNARPKVAQQPSDVVRERNDRLAVLGDKIAALRQARESAAPNPMVKGEPMPGKRELIDTGADKRYVRRNARGTSFVESDDVGRSLAADRRQHAKTKVASGQGDKGDRAKATDNRKTAGRKAATRKPARKTKRR